PEGPNARLLGAPATSGRVNAFGFGATACGKGFTSQGTDQAQSPPADEEDRCVLAQADAPPTGDLPIAHARLLVRRKAGECGYVSPEDVDYMDVSPRQMVSVATAMIPFLEHDDANRALMGANMMRQAVPLIKSESPLVGTGMEYRSAVDAGDVVKAEKA